MNGSIFTKNLPRTWKFPLADQDVEVHTYGVRAIEPPTKNVPKTGVYLSQVKFCAITISLFFISIKLTQRCFCRFSSLSFHYYPFYYCLVSFLYSINYSIIQNILDIILVAWKKHLWSRHQLTEKNTSATNWWKCQRVLWKIKTNVSVNKEFLIKYNKFIMTRFVRKFNGGKEYN